MDIEELTELDRIDVISEIVAIALSGTLVPDSFYDDVFDQRELYGCRLDVLLSLESDESLSSRVEQGVRELYLGYDEAKALAQSALIPPEGAPTPTMLEQTLLNVKINRAGIPKGNAQLGILPNQVFNLLTVVPILIPFVEDAAMKNSDLDIDGYIIKLLGWPGADDYTTLCKVP